MGCGCGTQARSQKYEDPIRPLPEAAESASPSPVDKPKIVILETKVPIVTLPENPGKPGKPESPLAKAGEFQVRRSQFIEQRIDDINEDYTLKEQIGEGTFGTVFTAIHKHSGDKRAVKIIDRGMWKLMEESKLLQEIAILKQLDHPGIIQLHEVYSDPKHLYIVTEYIDGGELFDEMQRKTVLPEEFAADVTKQLLSCIVYCHNLSIMHRDLKPENIMIESLTAKRIEIKLIDFGSAQSSFVKGEYQPTMGTPYYIAPEVLMNNYSERCDIWSVGVILYIMLCGKPPFNGDSNEDIMRAVKKAQFSYDRPEWKSISGEAKEFIKKMLKYPPSLRATAREAYLNPWLQALQPDLANENALSSVLLALQSSNVAKGLQRIALMYIVTQLTPKCEKTELKQVFWYLDRDGDGRLSKADLLGGFKVLSGSEQNTALIVDEIFSRIDWDKNGFIDYSEYLVAAISKPKVLTDKNIASAFAFVTKGKKDYMEAKDLQEVLDKESRFPKEEFTKIVQEVDLDKDGKVSFDEFKLIMEQILKY